MHPYTKPLPRGEALHGEFYRFCQQHELRSDALRLGLPVEVVFDDVTPELTLPKFRPVRAL